MLTFSSGPNTNTASFWTKSSDGRPLPSSPPHPDNVQKNAIHTVKDPSSCGLQRCNGLGHCITEGQVTRCQCVAGYQGESCQEAETGRGHVAVILGVFFLVTALTLAAFVFAKRYWQKGSNLYYTLARRSPVYNEWWLEMNPPGTLLTRPEADHFIDDTLFGPTH